MAHQQCVGSRRDIAYLEVDPRGGGQPRDTAEELIERQERGNMTADLVLALHERVQLALKKNRLRDHDRIGIAAACFGAADHTWKRC